MDYNQVEEQFQILKQQFNAGTLDEAAFKAKLNELMVQDAQGRWWSIGYETGQWYTHDGSAWVRADPPRTAPPKPLQEEKDYFSPAQSGRVKATYAGNEPVQPIHASGEKAKLGSLSPVKERKKMGSGFWLGWVGSLAAGVAFLVWTSSIYYDTALLRVILGACVGFIQWLIMRQYIPNAGGWIIYNSVVMLFIEGTEDVVYGIEYTPLLLVIFILANLIVGPLLIARWRR